jgi:hypothetical protein
MRGSTVTAFRPFMVANAEVMSSYGRNRLDGTFVLSLLGIFNGSI